MADRVLRIGLAMLVSLMAGAIVNLAVSWSLSLLINPFSMQYDDPTTRWGQRLLEPNRQWWASAAHRCGAVRLSAYTGLASVASANRWEDPDELLPWWWRAGRFVDEPSEALWSRLGSTLFSQLSFDESQQFLSHAEGRGWPLVSMWYEPHHDQRWTQGSMDIAGGAVVPLEPWTDPGYRGADQPRALPLRVIWPHFAVNTLFYAVLARLLFMVPGALRQCLRRRRGLCPSCGYNLRGQTETPARVCPECGVGCIRI